MRRAGRKRDSSCFIVVSSSQAEVYLIQEANWLNTKGNLLKLQHKKYKLKMKSRIVRCHLYSLKSKAK